MLKSLAANSNEYVKIVPIEMLTISICLNFRILLKIVEVHLPSVCRTILQENTAQLNTHMHTLAHTLHAPSRL